MDSFRGKSVLHFATWNRDFSHSIPSEIREFNLPKWYKFSVKLQANFLFNLVIKLILKLSFKILARYI